MRRSQETIGRTPPPEVEHLTGFGIGPVSPTGAHTDSEVAREVAQNQQPIEGAAIVCIDERHSLGKPELVRRKSAGGAGMSGFEAAVLSDWYLLPSTPAEGEQPTANETFDFVATEMSMRNIALGAHNDNHAGEEATNCGAMDGAEAGNTRLATIGETELQPIIAAVMGDGFNPDLFAQVVVRAQHLEKIGFFKDWNSVQAQAKVLELGGVVEELNAEDVRLADDPENARHGHGAEAINHNTDPSKSSSRDGTDIRFFQLDKSAVDEIANVLARNPLEADLMRHAIYAFNITIAYGLTRNQRYVQT